MGLQMNNNVTVILTSSGRWDLLRKTVESFLIHNTYNIDKFIINDDSGEDAPTDLHMDFPFIAWVESKNSGIKRNQIASLDFLWSKVKTPYAFVGEDDWQFLQPGFIEASMKVLEQCPNVLQCWLNTDTTNMQPIEWITGEYGIFKTSGNLWSGTRFNPALKRKSDYDLIAPFSQHTEWNPVRPWKSEADISKVYHKLGFKGAMLNKTYIRHIGEGRHIN